MIFNAIATARSDTPGLAGLIGAKPIMPFEVSVLPSMEKCEVLAVRPIDEAVAA